MWAMVLKIAFCWAYAWRLSCYDLRCSASSKSSAMSSCKRVQKVDKSKIGVFWFAYGLCVFSLSVYFHTHDVS